MLVKKARPVSWLACHHAKSAFPVSQWHFDMHSPLTVAGAALDLVFTAPDSLLKINDPPLTKLRVLY